MTNFDENDQTSIADFVLRYTQNGKPAPPLTDFLGDASSRIYYAEVKEAWVNDERHLKINVDLNHLKRSAKNPHVN